MRSFYAPLALASGLFSSLFTHASPVAEPVAELVEIPDSLLRRQTQSCNTPTNRACWTTGFNISTDYEVSWPTTGRTVPVRPNPDARARSLGNVC